MKIRAIVIEGSISSEEWGVVHAALKPWEGEFGIVVDMRPPAPVPTARIIERVAFEMGVAVEEITGECRAAPQVRARFAVTWLATTVTGRSSTQIGISQGNRDHSTILNQLRRAHEMRRRDPAFLAVTDRLAAQLQQEIAA